MHNKANKPTHCAKGHPFTEDNTCLQMGANGKPHRICKQCRRDRTRLWMRERRKKRAAA